MFRFTSPFPQSPPPGVVSRTVSRPKTDDDEPARYGRWFWLTYASNTAVMTAVSLLFRYADFVHALKGTELDLGWIVGVGMFGSLLMRLAQGVGIDRYGPRQVWLWSTALFVVTCVAHLWVERIDTPFVYVLRVVYTVSVAGIFGSSITYVSRSASVARMAETIGLLGTSGFVGMVLGTYLGDVLCGVGSPDRVHLNRMFLAAAGMGAFSLVLAALATRGQIRPAARRQLPVFWVLRRYHPGSILLVGVAMGFGIGLPGIFLRAFAADLGIPKIAMFFAVYSPMAFGTRLATRRLPSRIGVRPMILAGLGCLVASMLLYLPIRYQWQFVIPAIFLGAAHAMLFPAVMAGGSAQFPVRYRGLSTTLMLAMFDLGNLVGAPLVGAILHGAREIGWPPWTTMFVSVAVLLALIGVYYAISSRKSPVGRVMDPADFNDEDEDAAISGSPLAAPVNGHPQASADCVIDERRKM